MNAGQQQEQDRERARTRRGKHQAHWHIFMAMLVKHYKVLFQSKSTLLTMILGPLIIVLLIGTAFNTTETQTLTVGVFSNTSSSLSGEIQQSLAQDFDIDITNSEKECKEKIVNSINHICVIFPNNLDPTSPNYNNELTVYADSSQLNLAYIIMDQLDSRVKVSAENISKRYVDELITTLTEVNTQLLADSTKINAANTYGEEISTSLTEVQEGVQTTDLAYEKPANSQLGQIVADLEETSIELEDRIRVVDDFQSGLQTQLTQLDNDLRRAEAAYEEGCGDEGEATDCDDQEDHIASLELERAELLTYIGPMLNSTLSDLAINVTLTVQSIKPTAIVFEDKLAEADEKLLEGQRSLAEVELSLGTALGKLQSIKTQLDAVSSSQTDMTGSIGAIEVTESGTIATPIKTTYKELQADEGTYINKMFPILLALFIMLVSILLSSTFVIIEKRSSAFIRNNIAPVYSLFFPITTLITLLSIILAESVVLLFIAQLFFGINSVAYFFHIILGIIILSSLFLLLGMDIGFLFDTEESVTLTSIFLASGMMLFSQLVFPLQSMTENLSRLAQINPFVMGSELFKKIILFEAGIGVYAYDLMLIAFYIIMFIGVFAIAYRLAIKKY